MSAHTGAPTAWPVSPPWPQLAPGADLTVVKQAPDGSEVTRYRGIVLATLAVGTWVVVEARWVNRQVDLDGLSFVPGDRLLECFSPVFPFNAFAVYTPDGTLRGWYANVTYPATMDTTATTPTLIWRDLYLDLVGLPDGTVVVRDEDELAESNLAGTDPDLHVAIIAAKDELLRRWAVNDLPFGELVGRDEPDT